MDQQLDIRFIVEKQRLVACPQGALSVAVRDQFYAGIVDRLAVEGLKHLVVDLGDVPNIDSSALGVLFSLYKHLVQKNGSLVLLRPTGMVAEVVHITHMEKIVQIKQSLDELPPIE
ncbi:MAG: STAS domain-containing protein [Deltaproteobacteria bacterium]|nr:STAS domain-containing protein [Candidatus Anaeroferrophillus wilburensis]MBN2889887.1 STAS domain-containing protein [Deltaproteobacteria bacterium]